MSKQTTDLAEGGEIYLGEYAGILRRGAQAGLKILSICIYLT